MNKKDDFSSCVLNMLKLLRQSKNHNGKDNELKKLQYKGVKCFVVDRGHGSVLKTILIQQE